MMPKLSHILVAVALVLAGVGSLIGYQSCARKAETKAEQQSHEAKGQADTHAAAAIAIPDHAKELAQAAKDVAGARAEVERLRRLVAAQRRTGVPDPPLPGPTQPLPVEPDHRDDLLAADVVLIAKQDGQIAALGLALADEQRRSLEFKAAFEAERRRAAGLEIALEAQKHVAASGKWLGRVQGVAVGVSVGFIAGRLR